MNSVIMLNKVVTCFDQAKEILLSNRVSIYDQLESRRLIEDSTTDYTTVIKLYVNLENVLDFDLIEQFVRDIGFKCFRVANNAIVIYEMVTCDHDAVTSVINGARTIYNYLFSNKQEFPICARGRASIPLAGSILRNPNGQMCHVNGQKLGPSFVFEVASSQQVIDLHELAQNYLLGSNNRVQLLWIVKIYCKRTDNLKATTLTIYSRDNIINNVAVPTVVYSFGDAPIDETTKSTILQITQIQGSNIIGVGCSNSMLPDKLYVSREVLYHGVDLLEVQFPAESSVNGMGISFEDLREAALAECTID